MSNRFWCFFGVHKYNNWEEIFHLQKMRTSDMLPIGFVRAYKATCEICGKMSSKKIEVSDQ